MISLTTTSAGTLQARAHRSLRSFMGRSLQPYRMTATGWALLGAVAHASGVRPSQIADELGVRRPMVAQLIREFEKRGFIKSIPDHSDTRAKIITLTTHGVTFVEMLEMKLRTDMHGFLDDVPVTDLTTYFRVLRLIANKSNVQNN